MRAHDHMYTVLRDVTLAKKVLIAPAANSSAIVREDVDDNIAYASIMLLCTSQQLSCGQLR